MKTRVYTVLMASTLVLMGSLTSVAKAADPEACSIAVGVTTRLGTFRTWTNALETNILEQKGLQICQDDAVLNLSNDQLADLDEAKWERLLRCKTEFKLELLFRNDNMTRNVTIFKAGKIIFDQDYPANPYSIGSLKILKTIPDCAALQKLAAPNAGK